MIIASERQTFEQKKVEWEFLQNSRPQLIIEVGAFGGEALMQLRREFKDSGKYSQSRYLGIDKQPQVEKINSLNDFALGLEASVGEQNSEVREFYGMANEIWLKNVGVVPFVNKAFIQEIYNLLAENGRVIIFDTFTNGLYRQIESLIPNLESQFIVQDYSKRPRENTHPLVQKSLMLQSPSSIPVVIELVKRAKRKGD